MILDKPFNRAEPDPRTQWRQQGSLQIPPRPATAHSGAQYDDEQEFYEAQGYNLDDGHSDDLPDGDYPFEESYANYSDSPTNNNAVNETQVRLADDANDLSEAYTCIHGDNSSSNNKLHKHLRTGHTNSMDSNAYHATALVPKVMESSIYNNIEPSHSFPGIPLGIHAKPPHTTPCSIYDEQQVVIPPFTQAHEDAAEMARADHVLRIGPAHGIGVADPHDTTAYVQRQLDNKLRELHEFVRGYIDDIIIFSDILDNHLDRLDRFFARLKELDIHLAPTQAYKEKLRAITDLKFPYILKQLRTYSCYCGFTGWKRVRTRKRKKIG
jgi:hypothetical protein